MTWQVNIAGALTGVPAARGLPPAVRTTVLGILVSTVLQTIIDSWPVDTGLSLSRFSTVQRGGEWFVSNPVEYVPHVHNGVVDRLAADGIALARSKAPAVIQRVGASRERGPTRRRIVVQRRRRLGLGGVEPPPTGTPAALPTASQVVTQGTSAAGAAASALASSLALVRVSAATQRAAMKIVQRAIRAGASPSIEAYVRTLKLEEAARQLRRAGFRKEAREIEELAKQLRDAQ